MVVLLPAVAIAEFHVLCTFAKHLTLLHFTLHHLPVYVNLTKGDRCKTPFVILGRGEAKIRGSSFSGNFYCGFPLAPLSGGFRGNDIGWVS